MAGRPRRRGGRDPALGSLDRRATTSNVLADRLTAGTRRFVWRPLVLTLVSVVGGLVFAPAASARSSSALPELHADGVGSARFGVPKAHVVASLRRTLGKPTAEGVSRACGPLFTEVAWHDLIAEFRAGRFTGYRFVEGGWALWTSRSVHPVDAAAPPSPALRTARGITLGSTLGRLRAAYGTLKLSGAIQWTASNGLSFIESSSVVNPRSAADRIAEIHVGTCGTDQ